MVSVTVQRVQRRGEIVRFLFSDGSGKEFHSVETVREAVAELDSPQNENFLKLLAIAWFLKREPTGDNVVTIEGKTMTLDLAAATPLRVT